MTNNGTSQIDDYFNHAAWILIDALTSACTKDVITSGGDQVNICLHRMTCFQTGCECTQFCNQWIALFGALYILLTGVCAIQLMLHIWIQASSQTHGSAVLNNIFHVTVQKSLYLLLATISGLRAFFFLRMYSTFPVIENNNRVAETTLAALYSTFYVGFLTVQSLLICFWAEIVHVDSASIQMNRFLDKSLVGFIIFNSIVYSLFITNCMVLSQKQMTTHQSADFTSGNTSVSVENLIFQSDPQAMHFTYNKLLVLICTLTTLFFVVYAVCLYFTARGKHTKIDERHALNLRQAIQSRFGICSQILFLTIIVVLLSDSKQWLRQYASMNMFANYLIEFATVVWFPCTLWDSRNPERLWILNPRLLWKINEHTANLETQKCPTNQIAIDKHLTITNYNDRPSIDRRIEKSICESDTHTISQLETTPTNRRHKMCDKLSGVDHRPETSAETTGNKLTCWVCLGSIETAESARRHAAASTCLCRGQLTEVHETCLKQWLIALIQRNDASFRVCRHCQSEYRLRCSPTVSACSRERTVCVALTLVYLIGWVLTGTVFVTLEALDRRWKVLVIGVWLVAQCYVGRYLNLRCWRTINSEKIRNSVILGCDLCDDEDVRS